MRTPKSTRLIDTTSSRNNGPNQPTERRRPPIHRIITIASAKGGVGKSTVAVNLAVAMAQVGLKVGLMDADIYGPNCQILLGSGQTKPQALDDGRLAPIIAHKVRSFSIAYVSDPEKPMLWRGPVVSQAIQKMFYETAWAEASDPLDILIIDTPPGTGEAHLTLAQSLPIDAAVLITTPSALALADIRRGAGMYDRLETPIIGIVETMSYIEHAGGRLYPFGREGAQKIAQKIGAPILAEIPILQSVNIANETGQPACLGPDGNIFMRLGHDISNALDTLSLQPVPQIVFENC